MNSTADFLRTVLPPLRDGEVWKTFTLEGTLHREWFDLEKLANFAHNRSERANVYVAVWSTPSGNKQRTNENAMRTAAVVADVDFGEGKRYATAEDALKAIHAFPLGPHAIVATGRGFHVWWLLTEPTSDKDRWGSVVNRLAVLLVGDHIGDAARVLRIPDTRNIDSVIRLKDCLDYDVTLQHFAPDEPRYTLEAFEALLPAAKAQEKGSKPPIRDHNSEPLRLADEDLLRVAFAATNGNKIRALWEGNISAYGDDDSAADMALLCFLVFYTGDDAAQLDRMFRASGLCQTPERIKKWERLSRHMTAKAIADRGGTYTPGGAMGDARDSTFGRSGVNPAPGETATAIPAPTYPIESLPESVRTYVIEAAKSLDSVVDFIATALLPVAGGTLGNRVSIDIKKGWNERPQLWGVNIGEPGSAKSPALRKATVGIEALQTEATVRFLEAKERYAHAEEAWSKAKPSDRGEKPLAPLLRHFFTTNVTIEAIAPMLLTSGGLVVCLDELSGWVSSMDQFKPGGKGNEKQTHLTLWDGGTIKNDRKGQDSIYLERPVVSVVGGIQPSMLASLIDPASLDGFADRPLYSWPEFHAPGWTEDEVSDDATAAFIKTFEHLTSVSGVFRFSPEAKVKWVSWVNEWG